jgi:hypothetical protein
MQNAMTLNNTTLSCILMLFSILAYVFLTGYYSWLSLNILFFLDKTDSFRL